ncbi:MAG: hypothetical protein MUC88_09880 [Planctomycetes bacterium]|jgi:hypothetical protein|nr:hypothetical protein [Planctomycetota bacterium]
MRRRNHIKFVPILVLTLILGVVAGAADEQWLQYRSLSEARQIVGDIGYLYTQLSSAQPRDVKLPQLAGDQPLFLEWVTPMAASGRVWIVFDKSKGKGDYDRLYLDANANGDLSDDPACPPYRRESMMAYFGPVKVVFASADGPITYHLNLEIRSYPGQSPMCLMSPGGWYEGPITVGGVKKQCLLIDHNVNGTFNDKSADYSKSDRIRIGEPGRAEAGAVGKYIEVDNKLYQVEVARDGAFVTLAPAGQVPYGAVRLSEGVTTVTVAGENGSFVRKPENGIIKLPVGAYQVDSWSVSKKDNLGATWELRGMLPPGAAGGTLTAAQDQEASLSVGEPVYSMAQVSQSGSTYSFSQRLEGRQGERIVLTRNGSQPPAPKLRIRSRDGTYDRSLTAEYG